MALISRMTESHEFFANFFVNMNKRLHCSGVNGVYQTEVSFQRIFSCFNHHHAQRCSVRPEYWPGCYADNEGCCDLNFKWSTVTKISGNHLTRKSTQWDKRSNQKVSRGHPWVARSFVCATLGLKRFEFRINLSLTSDIENWDSFLG